MTGTRTIHEEVIKIDFDSEQAKARLAELQRAGEALLKLMGGPMPVFGGGGVPGVGGGGVGGAASSTVSTVTTAVQTQAQAATSAAVGGGVPGAAPQSATVSSGEVASGGGGGRRGGSTRSTSEPPTWETDPWAMGLKEAQIEQNRRWTAGEIDPRRNSPLDAWGRPMSAAWHGGIQGLTGGASGMARGTFSALGAIAGGGMIGSMISSLGSITGFEGLSQANAIRSRLENTMGLVDMSGAFGSWSGAPPGTSSTNALDEMLWEAQRQGITPTDYSHGMRSYGAAMGGSVGPERALRSASPLLQMMLAGVSPSTIGAVDAMAATHGALGGEGAAGRLAGIGQRGFGMVGGLDQWMQSLTGQIDRLLDRGIKVSLTDTASLLEAMAADPTLRHLGSKAPSVVGAIGGVAADARQTLLAPFQQLGHHAVLADALQQAGGDPFEAVRVTERMGQKGVRRAISNLLGTGDLGSAAMANITRNLGLDESGSLLGLKDGAPSYSGPEAPAYRFRERSAIEASRDFNRAVRMPGTVGQQRRQVGQDIAADNARNFMGKGMDNAARVIMEMASSSEAFNGHLQTWIESLNGAANRIFGSLGMDVGPRPAVDQD